MGTRGCYGVRIDGKDHITYNHFDSYPAGLGTDIVAAILYEQKINGNLDKWKEKARQLKGVKDTDTPTEEDKQRFAAYYDETVSNKSEDDWYCLLRRLQGDIAMMLDLGTYIDNHNFMQNGLFCEWAYIINFDTDELEVYRGFYKEPQAGRFANLPPAEPGFAPVALIRTFPLININCEQIKAIERAVDED
jgi:hypothetical protein